MLTATTYETAAKRLAGGVLIITAVLALVAPAAGAQTPAGPAPDDRESITLSPSSESFEIDAGDTRRDSMLIINDGDIAYDFTVYTRPYSVQNELYAPNFSRIKKNTNVHRWVQFEKTKYRIEPGQRATVNYTIRVPATAAPGGHYGVIFAETQERGINGSGVARQKRVGNLLYATVKGQYKTAGRFDEFILPMWQKRAPMLSNARVTNTGNVDFEAEVTTTAKDMFGRTKFTYHGDPRVLPDTTRRIEMNWERAPNFGVFRVTQHVSFLGQDHTQARYVLIAPLWFAVLAAVSVLIGAGYAVTSYRKKRR